MPPRVFISYASENSDFAERAYHRLKTSGVSSWIAAHDIPPADSWIKAIMQAIKTCDVVVLLLCNHANSSKHVINEAERAFHYNKRILTVRLDDLLPCDELEYLLARHQWLEAHALSHELALGRIVEKVKSLLDAGGPVAESPPLADPLDAMDLADLVKEGIDLVMDEIGKLSAMEKSITPREIFRVLDTAIYYGAPAYNRGSILGCAEIYLTTCQGLAKALASKSLSADEPWASPYNRFASEMHAIQAGYPKAESSAANPLAWALRHRFDAFHAALGIEEIQGMMDQIQAACLPIQRDMVLLPVLVAIKHGNRVFEANDFESCADLHHYTAKRVCEFLEGAASKSSLRTDPHLFMFHQDLKDLLKKYPQVDPATAQTLAWDLYSTFLQIIKAPPA